MPLCFTRSFRALLWRNAIYRKRRWKLSLVEFFLPPLCVAALYFIKVDLEADPNSSLRSVVIPDYFPDSNAAIVPLSFQDYVTALRAERACVVDPTATALEKILGLAPLVISGINYRDWPVPCEFNVATRYNASLFCSLSCSRLASCILQFLRLQK